MSTKTNKISKGKVSVLVIIRKEVGKEIISESFSVKLPKEVLDIIEPHVLSKSFKSLRASALSIKESVPISPSELPKVPTKTEELTVVVEDTIQGASIDPDALIGIKALFYIVSQVVNDPLKSTEYIEEFYYDILNPISEYMKDVSINAIFFAIAQLNYLISPNAMIPYVADMSYKALIGHILVKNVAYRMRDIDNNEDIYDFVVGYVDLLRDNGLLTEEQIRVLEGTPGGSMGPSGI